MLVEAILEAKGRRLITVAPETLVSDAAATLARERIGAVPILSTSGELLGILSERDIVHALRAKDPGVFEQSVADLMTPSVVTCDPDSDSESLMEEMLLEHIRHLPVMRDGAVVGIVSIVDVAKAVVEDLKWMRTALQDQVARSAAWSTEDD